MNSIKQFVVFVLLVLVYGTALCKVEQPIVFEDNQISKVADYDAFFSIATPGLIATNYSFSFFKLATDSELTISYLFLSRGFSLRNDFKTYFFHFSADFFATRGFLTTNLKRTIFPFHSFL